MRSVSAGANELPGRDCYGYPRGLGVGGGRFGRLGWWDCTALEGAVGEAANRRAAGNAVWRGPYDLMSPAGCVVGSRVEQNQSG